MSSSFATNSTAELLRWYLRLCSYYMVKKLSQQKVTVISKTLIKQPRLNPPTFESTGKVLEISSMEKCYMTFHFEFEFEPALLTPVSDKQK